MCDFINKHFSELLTALVAIIGMLITYMTAFANFTIDRKKQQRQFLLSIFFPLIEKLNYLLQLYEQQKDIEKSKNTARKILLNKNLISVYDDILEILKTDYNVCDYFLHRHLTVLYVFILNDKYAKEHDNTTQYFINIKPPNIQRIIKSLTKSIQK